MNIVNARRRHHAIKMAARPCYGVAASVSHGCFWGFNESLSQWYIPTAIAQNQPSKPMWLVVRNSSQGWFDWISVDDFGRLSLFDSACFISGKLMRFCCRLDAKCLCGSVLVARESTVLKVEVPYEQVVNCLFDYALLRISVWTKKFKKSLQFLFDARHIDFFFIFGCLILLILSFVSAFICLLFTCGFGVCEDEIILFFKFWVLI